MYLTSDFVVWLLPEQKKGDLVDYKFYTFGGEAKYCQVISNRFKNETIDFFDMNWNWMDFTGLSYGAVKSDVPPRLPVHFEEMKRVVKQLAIEIPFMRVDLYDTDEGIYFGEFTFYPNTGLGTFMPKEQNILMGENIALLL